MISNERVEYYMLNETVADEDACRKVFHMLNENVVDLGGHKIFTITFKQLLSECDVKNFNGRVYRTMDMWNAWTKNPLIQRDLETSGVVGEYSHPQLEKGMNELARQMTIDPKNACWSIKNLSRDNNKIYGEATTLAGGWGDVMRDRALSGTIPMASTRAIGGCDAKGNVLPGFQLICADGVFRPSSKNALADMSTLQVNTFSVPKGNSMSESAVAIDLRSEGMKDFLLTEAVSRDKIYQVCDTLKLDFDSMVLTENALTISRIDGNERTTIVMPIHRLVGAHQYHLFD